MRILPAAEAMYGEIHWSQCWQKNSIIICRERAFWGERIRGYMSFWDSSLRAKKLDEESQNDSKYYTLNHNCLACSDLASNGRAGCEPCGGEIHPGVR